MNASHLRRSFTSIFAAVAIVFVCAGAAGARSQNQNQNRGAYRAAELISRWKVIVNVTFEGRRASAEESILESIEIVLSPGAVKAVQDRATEQQLKNIDASVEKLALAMVTAGEHLPDGSVAIREESIDAGLKNVCPMYPFC